MKNHILPYLILTLLTALNLSFTCYGQKNVDSIIRVNSQEVLVNPDTAIETLTSVFNDADTSTDDKIYALMLISTGYTTKRDYQMALTTSLRLLDFIPYTTNYKLKINAFNQIGGHYQQINLTDKANEYLDKALNLALKHVAIDTTLHGQLGINYGLKGQLFREQLSTKKALNYFDKAINEFNLVTDNERLKLINLCIMYFNQANCYIDNNDLVNAKYSYEKSAKYAQDIQLERLIASTKKALAKLEALDGNHEASLDLLSGIENSLDNINDLTIKAGVYAAIANDYLVLGNAQEHEVYYHKSIANEEALIASKLKISNATLSELITTKTNEVKTINKKFTLYQYVIVALIFVLIALFFNYHIKSQKQLIRLQKEIKFKKA